MANVRLQIMLLAGAVLVSSAPCVLAQKAPMPKIKPSIINPMKRPLMVPSLPSLSLPGVIGSPAIIESRPGGCPEGPPCPPKPDGAKKASDCPDGSDCPKP